MKTLCKSAVVFVTVYLILSLPMILGFGVKISFVPGVTCFSKVKTYFVTGIVYNYPYKLIISFVVLKVIILIRATGEKSCKS